MLIIHESMPKEAEELSQSLQKVYGFKSKTLEQNLNEVFIPIPEFNGFHHSSSELYNYFANSLHLSENKLLLLTNKDLYFDNQSKNDDWIFGYCYANIAVVSSARLKRYDNLPSKEIVVPNELYLKRLEHLSIHEIGHDVVKSPHFQMAQWVNTQNKHALNLGAHCTNNSCVMYEIVDINAPPKEEGYLQIGNIKKYDAGLDDVLARINPDWFCKSCKEHINIHPNYYKE